MLLDHTQPVTVGEPVLVTGTDLRVTYRGPDQLSRVERVAGLAGDVVLEAFQLPPNTLMVLGRPFGTSLQTWSVAFEPGSTPDRALVHVTEGPPLIGVTTWW